MVLLTQTITSGDLAEAVQVDDVQSRDVVWQAAQELLPVALFPEAEAFHLGPAVAHGREAVWCALEIVVH